MQLGKLKRTSMGRNGREGERAVYIRRSHLPVRSPRIAGRVLEGNSGSSREN